MGYSQQIKIKDYAKSSPKFEKLDWQDLPKQKKLKLSKFPGDIRNLGNFVSVDRLLNSKIVIASDIIGVKKEMAGKNFLKVKFPIKLNNLHYVRLYSLMVSEGSYRTEFSLNVPEDEFHELFKISISNLISEHAGSMIKLDKNSGFLRSRAPAVIRHLIPLPDQIPKIILNNKEFSREYLRVAFEAEGSPILNLKQHKRYIKISRYVDITRFVKGERLPLGKRLYLGHLKIHYPKLIERIDDFPPKLLFGEQILLKRHFDIDSKIQLEAIRQNYTGLRCGKITARWVLFIYANNIDKFIKEIGFLSDKKNTILAHMNQFRSNNPQYSTLDIIKNIANAEGYFKRKDFIQEMEKLGYKSPSCYLWRYNNKGLIKRIKKGLYKILL